MKRAWWIVVGLSLLLSPSWSWGEPPAEGPAPQEIFAPAPPEAAELLPPEPPVPEPQPAPVKPKKGKKGKKGQDAALLQALVGDPNALNNALGTSLAPVGPAPVDPVPGGEVGGKPSLTRKKLPVIKMGPHRDDRGCLDKAMVQRLVHQHQPRMRSCYERLLLQQPKAQGKVVVRFTVGAEGTVTTAKIQSSHIGDETFQACLLDSVRRYRFPKPPSGGEIHITYPYNFTLQNEE